MSVHSANGLLSTTMTFSSKINNAFLCFISSLALADGFGVPSLRLSASLASATRVRRQERTDSTEDGANDILSQLASGIDLKMRVTPHQGSKVDLLLQQAGTYDRDAIQEKIDTLIKENPVAMLTFTECPYCIEARSILDDLECKYTELNLDTVGRDSYAYRAELFHLTGRTSVPGIWIGGTFVGGCNDGPMGGLMFLKDSGRLKELLEKAGAL